MRGVHTAGTDSAGPPRTRQCHYTQTDNTYGVTDGSEMRSTFPGHCRSCGARLARDNMGNACSPCQTRARDLLAGAPEVPAGFWAVDEISDALASWHMGRVITAYRRHPHHPRQLPQDLLAGWVGITQAQLSRIENGPAPKDLDKLIQWAQILRIPEPLLWFRLPDRANKARAKIVSSNFSEPLAATSLASRVDELIQSMPTEPPHRIGASDVARVEATTAAFRDWDNRWGGSPSYSAVLAQLRWVASAATTSACSSQEVKSNLLTALSDLAGVAAFLSYDLNLHDAARALWMLGLEASREAGNADLAGTTLRQLAHQALHLDQPTEAFRLIRLAYTTTVDPSHHLDLTELTALRGHSYHVLAYRAPQAAGRAQTLLRRAVNERASDFARSRVLNQIALSATFFQRNDQIEEGVSIGHQAIDDAGMLTSSRVLERLRSLRSLTIACTDVPAVKLFRERLDSVVAHA